MKLRYFLILAATVGLFSSTSLTLDHQVVKNTVKGIWDGAKTISLHDEMIIGSEIGDESEMFGYIRGLTIDPKDNIYVADSYELNISVYSAEGEYLREFGREGQGPGEFQTIDDICWCKKDSNLYITDRRNHRINRFSPEGKHLGSVKDTLFNASIEGISSLEDGCFVLSARSIRDNSTEYRIITTDFAFQKMYAECMDEFPAHTVGIKWAPRFSDVGVFQGDQIYYTSPSEYKIVLLNSVLEKNLTVLKSHPRMFIPQYVQGFYADFNTIETLLAMKDLFVVGVHSTQIKNIPKFKTKRDFIEFTHTPDLKDWNLERACQLDFFDKDFKFLGCVEIPKNRRLAGKDSKDRLYFIEQEPFPRVVCCRLEIDE